MKWQPTEPVGNLKTMLLSFGKTTHTKILDVVQMFLERLSSKLDIELAVVVPELSLECNPEIMPAIETFKKMQALGIAGTIHLGNNTSYPDEPPNYFTNIGISGEKRFGYSGSGKSLFSRSATIWPAVGEALERWSLDHFMPNKNDLVFCSYKALGVRAVNIMRTAGFSDDLRAQGHPRYDLYFTEDTPFIWTATFSLTKQRTIYAPLQWFSFKQTSLLKNKSEPLLSPPITTGAATGQTLPDAILGGILEVIERDAFMIYWLNKISPDRISIEESTDPELIWIKKIAERYGLEFYFLHLKTDVPVHTILSVVIDRTGVGPAITVDSSTKFEIKSAITASIEGALSLRILVRNLMKTKSELEIDTSDLSKFDHNQRLLYWSSLKNLPEAEFLIQGSQKSILEFEDFAKQSSSEHVDTLVQQLRDHGHDVIYTRLLSKEQRTELGLETVMVKIPTFQPLNLHESMRVFKGDRIASVPKKLGIVCSGEINQIPHPFA